MSVNRASGPLASGQPTADRSGWDNRLDRLEPDEPANFFHIVVGIPEVGAPARRRDRQACRHRRSRSRRRPPAAVRPRSDRQRCRAPFPAARQRSRCSADGGTTPRTVCSDSSVPPACSTRSSATRRAAAVARLRVDTALEPPGRLRRQLVTSRGARNRHRIEMGCLDDDIAGACRELGGGSAHHTSQADGARGVGDQQVFRMQGTHHVVEGGQLFALSRLAYDNRSVEELRIVGMDGLTGFQHHVVGDVDCQRDGAHPGELHAAGEPPWARPIRDRSR